MTLAGPGEASLSNFIIMLRQKKTKVAGEMPSRKYNRHNICHHKEKLKNQKIQKKHET